MSVSKNCAQFHFIGTIDELCCHLGLIKAMLSNEDAWQFSWLSACNFIEKIQKNLMKIMAHAYDPKDSKYFFTDTEIGELVKEIDKLKKNLPVISKFVIPGKNIIEAQIQIGRAIARRAERHYAAINENGQYCSVAGEYLNKLSTYLFTLSQQESLINVNFINQISGL
ncbi:MAG: ATP:cob(I)alamin adenosyltransferase [Treponema sp.]|nr:ATP:cob(I)alamin adenosyltransferase [Treponema sp.]MCL2272619.1 ATP:cob(I)alamin adenosyltransferase [Treponema sp.]